MDHDAHPALRPKLISFDVFGTLISVRDSSYDAFQRILADAEFLLRAAINLAHLCRGYDLHFRSCLFGPPLLHA